MREACFPVSKTTCTIFAKLNAVLGGVDGEEGAASGDDLLGKDVDPLTGILYGACREVGKDVGGSLDWEYSAPRMESVRRPLNGCP